ncbi:hypothetical protein [Enterococcus mundtii]|uniref:hypothetical protein n=1 Tax=Enterococcus mundtii TaxID=53346 RepID=UPI0021598A84|nr:hypothetical protein [Enterococcus mundtii]
MKINKLLVSSMVFSTLATVITPSAVSGGIAYADENKNNSEQISNIQLSLTQDDTLSNIITHNQDTFTISDENGVAVGETIYEDEKGNIYTDSEIIVQKTTVDPRILAKSLSASPISIGILWTYTTSNDGTTLRNTFRKCATAEGVVAITGILLAAGIATAGLTAVLAALVGLGAVAFHSRFNEGADLINSHPSSGKIYMYLDHCTYKSL